MNKRQKEVRTIEVRLNGLQVQALRAYSAIAEPHSCTEDHKHGDFTACFGYAPKFLRAVYQGFDAIFEAWEDAADD